MMSDVFCAFLTPHPPLIRFCPISGHAPKIWCPNLTLRPPLWFYIPKFDIFSHFWQKNHIYKSVKYWFQNFMIKESTYCKLITAKNDFSKTNLRKKRRTMGCPIFAKLPTPLVLFCPILLDPPLTPPKIGHHLCMFPYLTTSCEL